MATSADYQKELAAMGNTPDFRNTIASAYETPVLRPLVQEGADLEQQYLPTAFAAFKNMGTGRGDMSAAAKLSMTGAKLGTLGSRISSNRNIQNFYNSQIQDLANNQLQQRQMQEQKLKDLYSMAFQKEEADRAEAARRRSEAIARASIPQYDFGGGATSNANNNPFVGPPMPTGGNNLSTEASELFNLIKSGKSPYLSKFSQNSINEVLQTEFGSNLQQELDNQNYQYSPPKERDIFDKVWGGVSNVPKGAVQGLGWLGDKTIGRFF